MLSVICDMPAIDAVCDRHGKDSAYGSDCMHACTEFVYDDACACMCVYTDRQTDTHTHTFTATVTVTVTVTVTDTVTLCVCVCVCVRERERERETQTHTRTRTHTRSCLTELVQLAGQRALGKVTVRRLKKRRELVPLAEHKLSAPRTTHENVPQHSCLALPDSEPAFTSTISLAFTHRAADARGGAAARRARRPLLRVIAEIARHAPAAAELAGGAHVRPHVGDVKTIRCTFHCIVHVLPAPLAKAISCSTPARRRPLTVLSPCLRGLEGGLAKVLESQCNRVFTGQTLCSGDF